MAGDVADRHRQPAVLERQHVVEVAADLGRRQVGVGELDAVRAAAAAPAGSSSGSAAPSPARPAGARARRCGARAAARPRSGRRTPGRCPDGGRSRTAAPPAPGRAQPCSCSPRRRRSAAARLPNTALELSPRAARRAGRRPEDQHRHRGDDQPHREAHRTGSGRNDGGNETSHQHGERRPRRPRPAAAPRRGAVKKDSEIEQAGTKSSGAQQLQPRPAG